MRRRSIALALTAAVAGTALAVLPATSAQANGQPALADLYTVMIWAQPASVEQLLCTQLRTNPAKAQSLTAKQIGSGAVSASMYGLTPAQGKAAFALGLRQACSGKPSAIVQASAISGLTVAAVEAGGPSTVTEYCTAYATDPQSVVAKMTASKAFSSWPVSPSNLNAGIGAGLDVVCSAAARG